MWVAKERERVASEEFQAARDEAITNTTNIQLAQMKQGEAKMNSQMAYSKVDGVGLDIMRAKSTVNASYNELNKAKRKLVTAAAEHKNPIDINQPINNKEINLQYADELTKKEIVTLNNAVKTLEDLCLGTPQDRANAEKDVMEAAAAIKIHKATKTRLPRKPMTRDNSRVAAIKAQLERETGQDLNGDGTIGSSLDRYVD